MKYEYIVCVYKIGLLKSEAKKKEIKKMAIETAKRLKPSIFNEIHFSFLTMNPVRTVDGIRNTVITNAYTPRYTQLF